VAAAVVAGAISTVVPGAPVVSGAMVVSSGVVVAGGGFTSDPTAVPLTAFRVHPAPDHSDVEDRSATSTGPVAPSGASNTIQKMRFGANARRVASVTFDRFAFVYVRGPGNCVAHVPVSPPR